MTEDWNEYDMRKPVMLTPYLPEEALKLTQGIYKSCITPKFVARKILSIRNMDDIKFFIKAGRFMLGHLKDFAVKQPQVH